MIRYRSTRGGGDSLTLSEALAQGLAPDGGLYVAEAMPLLDARTLDPKLPFVERTIALLEPFFAGDRLASSLPSIVERAFTFEAPLRTVQSAHGAPYTFLELFHGPTAAFKDFGARFLAECLSVEFGRPACSAVDTREETTILVATSGDTGAAVAGAFAGRPGFRVVVLYPDGRVSPRQAHQLGAFGGNVRAYRVAGTFDDCQAMVKGAFREAGIHPLPTKLASANSISLGRLLPQMAYYVHAAVVRHAERGGPVSFVIPTGNLGNGLAALLARALRTPSGERLPIENVHLATNANAVVGDYLRTGTYEPKASVATLANAMDVGAPSNLERLQSLADVVGAASLRATSVEDTRIRATISQVFGETGYAICPHTACGVAALMDMSVTDATNWVVASTAHPAKFESIVEPLCGPVAPPPALAALLARPSEATPMPATLASLLQALSAP